jgi:hypothetical protein
MKIHARLVAPILLLAISACSKTNSQSSYLTHAGEGGWDIGLIKTGLSNISLVKNTDTTISIPISLSFYALGKMSVGDSITFGPLPPDVVSVIPASSLNGGFMDTTGKLTNAFAFHIHAIDTGTFQIVVLAYGGHAPDSATFKLIVH